MADSSLALDELVDLKILPAWANEPAPAQRYAHVQGETQPESGQERRPGSGKRQSSRTEDRRGRTAGRARNREGGRPKRPDRNGPRFGTPSGLARNRDDRQRSIEPITLKVAVRFLPRPAVLENVVAQIKESSVAYSLFALSRLFLAKPERYQVQLSAPEEAPLYQLGEDGAISSDRDFLERSAFRLVQATFYKVEISQSDPIKGNFTSVARDRLSGTILGPTNHHNYQKRLRGLYEQRFSRRMTFVDYQRQIEIVADPQLVEQWKDDVRKVTTYATVHEPAITFGSAAEAQRHFRDNYLPGLIRPVTELTIDGVASRQLGDRALYRLIENEWSRENGSPSRMMQELTTRFREAGLQVFRHRRGMLFVSPVRPRPLVFHDAAVSAGVKAIIEILAAHPRTNRKELADKILIAGEGEEAEKQKLALASDLHWLVHEGYVIEFNDGSLDLPRAKAKQPEKEEAQAAAGSAADDSGIKAHVSGEENSKANEESADNVVAAAEPENQAVGTTAFTTSIAEAEVGGS